MTAPDGQTPANPLDLPPPTVVQDEATLRTLLQCLEHAREIAVDTEADSLFSYREKVCLIQVTALEQDWLVDPLAGLDLGPLGRVLADPGKLKVLHDGEYDILLFKRERGFELRNLFDTRVAAATLGSKTPGLASVLEARFGVKLDKKLQTSDWRQRPLSPAQVCYARLDTHFLIPLMREQMPELARTGRDVIVESECRRLEALEPPDNSFDADEFVRIKGARALPPLERQVLRELYVLRERLAAEANQPPFRILNNETLILIAQTRPRHREELSRVPRVSSRQVRLYGDLLLEAVRRALELGPLKRFPALPARDGTGGFTEEQVLLHDRLKQWRKEVAERMGIDAAYVLNRHVLLRLVQQRPTDTGALARVEGVQPWQLERHGAEIVAVIARFEGELRRGELPLSGRRRGPA
jgi:ribonuclease D